GRTVRAGAHRHRRPQDTLRGRGRVARADAGVAHAVLRTAFLSVLLAVCGWAAAAWLTHDFQVWTDEGARRLEVALRPVPVPAVQVQDADGAHASLQALLEGEGPAPAGATIVDFFYTHCETICLSLGGSFQQLQ